MAELRKPYVLEHLRPSMLAELESLLRGMEEEELPTDVKLTGNNADTIITDEVHKMSQNIKKVIILNDHAIKTVQVAHSEAELASGKGYTYLARADLAAELKGGDVVLLEPKNKRPSSGYVIAVDEVQQVQTATAFDYKWVVQKFNPAPVEEYKEAIKKGVERMEKADRARMKKQLQDEIGCDVVVGSNFV